MLVLFALWFSGISRAGELRCSAQFEDSSSYQLEAETTDGNLGEDVLFFYINNDGMEIGSMLKTIEAQIAPGESLDFVASSGKTKVRGTALFDRKKNNYRGSFEISFAFNSNPPLQPAMTCDLTP